MVPVPYAGSPLWYASRNTPLEVKVVISSSRMRAALWKDTRSVTVWPGDRFSRVSSP